MKMRLIGSAPAPAPRQSRCFSDGPNPRPQRTRGIPLREILVGTRHYIKGELILVVGIARLGIRDFRSQRVVVDPLVVEGLLLGERALPLYNITRNARRLALREEGLKDRLNGRLQRPKLTQTVRAEGHRSLPRSEP